MDLDNPGLVKITKSDILLLVSALSLELPLAQSVVGNDRAQLASKLQKLATSDAETFHLVVVQPSELNSTPNTSQPTRNSALLGQLPTPRPTPGYDTRCPTPSGCETPISTPCRDTPPYPYHAISDRGMSAEPELQGSQLPQFEPSASTLPPSTSNNSRDLDDSGGDESRRNMAALARLLARRGGIGGGGGSGEQTREQPNQENVRGGENSGDGGGSSEEENDGNGRGRRGRSRQAGRRRRRRTDYSCLRNGKPMVLPNRLPLHNPSHSGDILGLQSDNQQAGEGDDQIQDTSNLDIGHRDLQDTGNSDGNSDSAHPNLQGDTDIGHQDLQSVSKSSNIGHRDLQGVSDSDIGCQDNDSGVNARTSASQINPLKRGADSHVQGAPPPKKIKNNQGKTPSKRRSNRTQNITYSNASSTPNKEDPPTDPNLDLYISLICDKAFYSLPQSSDTELPSLTANILLDSVIKQHKEGADDPQELSSLGHLLKSFQKCSSMDQTDAQVQLSYYLTCMEFACRINRYQTDNKIRYRSTVWKKMNEEFQSQNLKCPSNMTLSRYLSDGVSACAISGAGSIYTLVILATCLVRSAGRAQISNVIGRFAKLLRFPTGEIVTGINGNILIESVPDSPSSTLIKHRLIPAVAALRQEYPLKINILFPRKFLDYLNVENNVDCTDFEASDTFFDSLSLFNDFVKSRDWEAWACCKSPVGEDRYTLGAAEAIPANNGPAPTSSHPSPSTPSVRGTPTTPLSIHSSSVPLHETPTAHSRSHRLNPHHGLPTPSKEKQHSNVFTVKTNFDPELTFNKQKKHNKDNRTEFTAAQRLLAANATHCESLSDFNSKITAQLDTGKNTSGTYVRIPRDNLNGKIVQVEDINGNIIASLLPTMPEVLRRPLVSEVQTILPDILQEIDTSGEGDLRFPTVHFSIYNRYSNRGDGTPAFADPTTLQKGDRQPINTAQNTPRWSQETVKNFETFKALENTFEPVFSWIRTQLEELMPNTFQRLTHSVEMLPYCDRSPAHPFSSLVVNINVRTRIHRDHGDKDVCLVLVISDCMGGELCLMEPGIVLDMRNGDIAIFPSGDISHFNLDFKGLRSSIVLHTDRALDNWNKDANGWGHNVNIRFIGNDETDL